MGFATKEKVGLQADVSATETITTAGAVVGFATAFGTRQTHLERTTLPGNTAAQSNLEVTLGTLRFYGETFVFGEIFADTGLIRVRRLTASGETARPSERSTLTVTAGTIHCPRAGGTIVGATITETTIAYTGRAESVRTTRRSISGATDTGRN